MTSVDGKVAVVTGASSGIGEATARMLGERGARVVAAARRRDRLDALVEQIAAAGGQAIALTCDVSDRMAVAGMVEQALERFGGVDVLVNNAGIMPLAPIAKARFDEWDRMIDVNIKGVLYCIGCALPAMLAQGEGHIINISSVAGRRTFPNAGVYCGTKHAVHAISESLRNELAERAKADGNRVRVTIIAPGVVTTELPETILDEQTRASAGQYYASIRDPLQSQDIAAAILYAIESPGHVNVNEILVRPTAQVR